MDSFQEMNSYVSWERAQERIKEAEKKGTLTRERAKEVLDNARKNYSNNSYNKQMERMK